MKKHLFFTLVILELIAQSGKCQNIDTLIDVGGYRLYFHIIKGQGMPILFEPGSGADVSVWDIILKPIADVTHATLITYDRPGFGKSELDTTNDDINKHGILQGIEGLETGLQKLGYNGNIMLIAHSFGGFCATLYAARHPDKVKAAVLIDCNLVSWFTDSWVGNEMTERKRDAANIKKQSLPYYYQALNLQNTVNLMKKMPFPATTPVIDLVSETNFPDSALHARWNACHEAFSKAQPNRQGITAYGCGHFIFRDNQPLAISAIAKAYAGTQSLEQRDEILTRFLSYNIEATNEQKKIEVQYRHSMDDLNTWGHLLLQKGSKEKAVEVFKLNVLLYPQSTEVYQSLAEGYEATGNKELAIKNYRRSLELSPGNTNAEEHLKKLLPPPSTK